MLILFLGVYQAFKHFSGVDPLRLDPQTIVYSLSESKDAEEVIHKILGADFSNLFSGGFPEVGGITQEPNGIRKQKQSSEPIILKFALVSDSHSDNQNLSKALNEAKKEGSKFVIGLGDYTEVGTDEELLAAKKVFDSSGLPYYLTAGDHDLWNSRDKNGEAEAASHFIKILGSPYQSFADSNIRFLILYNSDNYQGVDDVQMSWLNEELERVKNNQYLLTLAFAHIPLYHPSSDHFMGKTTQSLVSQAGLITQALSEGGVSEVFFGDTHFHTSYTEPKYGLNMTVIGALASERNTQKPRFSIVEVHADGVYNVKDIEL